MPAPHRQRLLYETHLHTPLCKHARGWPEDYAQVAWDRGLRGITVTCHNPMPDEYDPTVRMTPGQMEEYVAAIARARELWAGKIDVLLGLECDYLPGQPAGIEWLNAQLHAHPFQYVLGSVHTHTREYVTAYHTEDWQTLARTYFGHLAEAAETGLFDALSHPDIIKNSVPEQWQVAAILPDIRRALERIARAGTAMELNTSGLQKPLPEMNPGPVILGEMCRRGIPVVVGSDAHDPGRVANHFPAALDLLAQAGYREVSYFVGRRRQSVPLDQARRSLATPMER